MNPLNKTTFLDFFKEFSKVPVQTLELYISVSLTRVPQRIWTTRWNYATALLTAHMLTLQGFGGEGSGGGNVTAIAVGDLSRSFGTIGEAGAGDAELRATRYGIMFVELRNEIIVGAMPAVRPRPPNFYEPA